VTTNKVRKHFTLTIPDELWSAFSHFMVLEQFQSEPAAAAAIIRMFFAANPADGLKASSRSQAYNDIRRKTIKLVVRSLSEVATILKMENDDANQG